LFFVRDIDSKVLTVWMRINLQSLVFAMHLGYILTGMLLCACVQMSNWEVLSQKIQEQMKDDSDDDSDESSTSSSTSSRSEVHDAKEEEENKKDR
jgi:hypothetical protein